MMKRISKVIFIGVLALAYTGCQFKQTVTPQEDGSYKVSTSLFGSDESGTNGGEKQKLMVVKLLMVI